MQFAHHEAKQAVYAAVGPRHCAFRRFVDDCRVVTGSARSENGELSYTLVGTTKSGHNDTTLGNSIINAAIAFEAALRLGLKCDIIVAGDDLLIVVEGDFDEHAFARHEAGLGIKPEYRKFDYWGDVSYISGIWVPSKNGLAFIPKPGRLLARLFWSTHPPSAKKVNDYKHSVVMGLLPTCGAIPVIGEFLRSNDRGGKVVPIGKRYFDFQCTESNEFDEALIPFFERRYDCNRDEIADLESVFRGLAGVPGLLVHPLADKIMKVDLADIAVRPLAC
jgi:hypothetical protein